MNGSGSDGRRAGDVGAVERRGDPGSEDGAARTPIGDRNRPVVVVGAGPVGVVAAILLAQRGFAVTVLERHSAPYPLPRAVHLDGEVLRVLQAVGVAGRFRAISRAMPGLRLVDGRGRTMAEFRRDALVGPGGHPEASMFDQPDLERLLLDELGGYPGIALRRGVTVLGVDGGRVRTDQGVIDAAAVIGCDGAESTVRRSLGIGVRDLGHTETWLVVDVRTPVALDLWDGVHQVCDPRRATTFMRVTGTRYRWEFRLSPGEDPDVGALLAPWLGDVAGVEVLRAARYTFRARVAQRWRAGTAFLLGDAAHETPPFIGQGLGAGLRDAHNLAWKLDLVRRGAPDSLLDTYQAERLPHATRTIRAAIVVGWALTGGRGPAAALRRTVVRAACRLPGVSRAALAVSSPRLPRGPLVLRGKLTGTICPQETDGWSDTDLGDGLTLVSLAGPGARARGAVARWLRDEGLVAAVIRPDLVVAATARTRAAHERLARSPVE